MMDIRFTRLAGTSEAAALLVVGPSLGTAVQPLWAAVADLLPARFQVVGWDLPGHGASRAAAGPFTIADLAATVRSLTAEWALGRPTYYAGVSLGGAVGFELALDPGPFCALAALASGPRIGQPSAWAERADFVRREGTGAMVEPSARRWFAPGFAKSTPEVADALLASLAAADAQSYAWACEALADFDRRDHLADVAVPVLVVAGSHDEVVPPKAARATVDDMSGATYRELAESGHLPPAEAPATLALLLTEFFTAAATRAVP